MSRGSKVQGYFLCDCCEDRKVFTNRDDKMDHEYQHPDNAIWLKTLAMEDF